MADPELEETLQMATTLVATLQGRGQTVATAESLTGGLLAGTITSAPGASAVYVGASSPTRPRSSSNCSA